MYWLIIYTNSINDTKVQEAYKFNVDDETTLYKNCKTMKKDNVTLGTYTIKCWSEYNKVHFIKLTWLKIPKKWECWYIELKKYINDILNKSTIRFQKFWKKNNFEYWYLLLGSTNINNEILKKWYAKYQEDWLNNPNFIISSKDSERSNIGIYKQCK